MTEKHFIISVCEDLTVKQKIGELNRNSNSTQYLDVELDGWKLNEGEELYIELSHYNDDTELTTNVGPLHLLFIEVLGRYVVLAPPELVGVPGRWDFSLEIRSNISETTSGELSYNSLTSGIDTLTVIDSIISATQMNSFSKEAELLTAAKKLTDAVLVGYTAEEAINASKVAQESQERAAESEENAARSASQAEEARTNAAQSAGAASGSASSAAQSADTAQAGASQAEISASQAEQSAMDADMSRQESQQAASEAKGAAQDAIESIGAIKDAAEILKTSEEVLNRTNEAVMNAPVIFSVTEKGLLHVELNKNNLKEDEEA